MNLQAIQNMHAMNHMYMYHQMAQQSQVTEWAPILHPV